MTRRSFVPWRNFRVLVRLEQVKEMNIRAADPEAAREKAVEIVTGWDGVRYAEADTRVHEVE